MALFQVDIEKRLGSEFWTNRYIVDCDQISVAIQLGEDIAAAEVGFHNAAVTFTRYRVASTAVDDEVYSITPLNLLGARNPGNQLLPLFNTLRADAAASTGRPSRKFWRGVLDEADIAGDAIVSNFAPSLAPLTALNSSGPGGSGIVDPQGQTLGLWRVHPFVQMRQLRRGRRRRQGVGVFN